MKAEHEAYLWSRLITAHARRDVLTDAQRGDLVEGITDDLLNDSDDAEYPELEVAAEALEAGDAYSVDEWVVHYRDAKQRIGKEFDLGEYRASLAPVIDETHARIDEELAELLGGDL